MPGQADNPGQPPAPGPPPSPGPPNNLPAADKAKLSDKANEVLSALATDPRRAFRTRYGEVHIESVKKSTTWDGLDQVEIRLAGATESGDPHFIIRNPPLLAEDPDGDIAITRPSGRIDRYRRDPLAAIAEVVARHGGARRKDWQS